MVSFTRRLVRTSMRRTDSRSSVTVMEKTRNPKSESRMNSEARNPNACADCPYDIGFRTSDFGLSPDFGFRISGFSSRHRHGVENLLDDRVGRDGLGLRLVGE